MKQLNVSIYYSSLFERSVFNPIFNPASNATGTIFNILQRVKIVMT